MRFIKTINHDEFKIGLYQWNNKYIVKIETGMYEQTYKIDQYEVQDESEIEKCLDTEFLKSVAVRFHGMQEDLIDCMKRNDVLF